VTRPVAAIETHISVLFFGPDRVYKLLKPMKTGFLDHSTLARRLAAVTAEYELNRRFAPDVYLGTSDLYEDGQVADRVLVMRRLPDERRLSRLVDAPDFQHHLRQVARRVATFHAASPVVTDEYPMTTAAGLLGLWESSLADIEPFVGTVVEPDEFARVQHLTRAYLEHSDALFAQRREMGAIRDGHGDLIADDIFMLDDGPRILDCLAFDADYRVSDVLADIGFLVMDVERLAGTRAAHDLLAFYCELVDEHHPSSLAHHYVAYRAHVRAKVAMLRLRQGDESARDLAIHHHRQAADHLERAKRRLLLVGGGPGTGKTTVARGLADLFNFAVIDSDTLRKDLLGIDHDDHDVGHHPELYAPAATDATYRRLVKHATLLLDAGESVILDATWNDDRYRLLARAAAEAHGADLLEIDCRVDPDIARQRIESRRAVGRDASDATPDLVARMADDRRPWPSAIALDTSAEIDVVLAEAVRALAAAGSLPMFRT
jgi:aminoglycoside phosphotransferase family enzyme/predicted kinase